MIYTGFEEHELKKLTALLDKLGLAYAAAPISSSAPGAAAPQRHTFDLYQVEIDDDAFRGLAAADLAVLERFRIFPPFPSPFTEEELARYAAEPHRPAGEPHPRLKQAAKVLAFLVVGLLYLYKRKLF
jgi:hypothetical protein